MTILRSAFVGVVLVARALRCLGDKLAHPSDGSLLFEGPIHIPKGFAITKPQASEGQVNWQTVHKVRPLGFGLPQALLSGVRTLCMAALLGVLPLSSARADCAAAPLETASDLAISFLTANGTQAAPGNLLAATIKKGTLLYDGTANALKYCDGTNWLTLADSGGVGSNSSGAAGYVQLSDGSGGFATSGNTAGQEFFWDNTNKRLGIGTVTPDAQLHLSGALPRVAFSNDAYINPDSTAADWYMDVSDSGNFRISRTGTGDRN
ncbi:MAG: hypothetical protein M5U16_01465 [Hyphomicrobium sp.]|nr:hypothetical protein [Hyphomicrobium sp.]